MLFPLPDEIYRLHQATNTHTDQKHRLLAAPGGLSAFLSTFNYTLYLLTYLEAKTLPLQARLYALLGKTLSPAAAAGPSHIAALGALLSSCRTTLRLFGLFPLYAWLRQLLAGPKPGQDPVLYATALTPVSYTHLTLPTKRIV